jgi:hypothetical protein
MFNDEYQQAISNNDFGGITEQQFNEIYTAVHRTIKSGRFKSPVVTYRERSVESTDKNGKPHDELVRTPIRLKDQLKQDALNSALVDFLDPNSKRDKTNLEALGKYHARKVARPYESEYRIDYDDEEDTDANPKPVPQWDSIAMHGGRYPDWLKLQESIQTAWGIPAPQSNGRAKAAAEARLKYEKLASLIGKESAEWMLRYVDTDASQWGRWCEKDENGVHEYGSAPRKTQADHSKFYRLCQKARNLGAMQVILFRRMAPSVSRGNS